MIGLFELARIRQERAGKKYVLENGQNAAMYRNNCLDIMEELADAHNIAELLFERLAMRGLNSAEMANFVTRCQVKLSDAAYWVSRIYDLLPEDMRRDLIEVERILPEN